MFLPKGMSQSKFTLRDEVSGVRSHPLIALNLLEREEEIKDSTFARLMPKGALYEILWAVIPALCVNRGGLAIHAEQSSE